MPGIEPTDTQDPGISRHRLLSKSDAYNGLAVVKNAGPCQRALEENLVVNIQQRNRACRQTSRWHKSRGCVNDDRQLDDSQKENPTITPPRGRSPSRIGSQP